MGTLGVQLRNNSNPLSWAVTVIAGWLWVTNFFVTQEQAKALQLIADSAHEQIVLDIAAASDKATKDTREVYYEVKIDIANAALAFMEQNGIQADEQREYDLRAFEVKFMTEKLDELK